LTALVAVGTVIGVRAWLHSAGLVVPACTIGAGPNALDLDPEQAANAATIAAVAKRMGLPDHAATVALAAALQESKLENPDYGDRDSVGVFQQRPSQGWGTRSQLLSPEYAATAFFVHLKKVPGWAGLAPSDAAQQVQHSADGSAYAQWVEQARVMAEVLTGELPARLSCRFGSAPLPRATALSAAAVSELGDGWQNGGVDAQRDWTVASWLVAHAYQFGIVAVSVRGERWTYTHDGWRRDSRAGAAPSYLLASPPRR
jgi:hypothetical protein